MKLTLTVLSEVQVYTSRNSSRRRGVDPRIRTPYMARAAKLDKSRIEP